MRYPYLVKLSSPLEKSNRVVSFLTSTSTGDNSQGVFIMGGRNNFLRKRRKSKVPPPLYLAPASILHGRVSPLVCFDAISERGFNCARSRAACTWNRSGCLEIEEEKYVCRVRSIGKFSRLNLFYIFFFFFLVEDRIIRRIRRIVR